MKPSAWSRTKNWYLKSEKNKKCYHWHQLPSKLNSAKVDLMCYLPQLTWRASVLVPKWAIYAYTEKTFEAILRVQFNFSDSWVFLTKIIAKLFLNAGQHGWARKKIFHYRSHKTDINSISFTFILLNNLKFVSYTRRPLQKKNWVEFCKAT